MAHPVGDLNDAVLKLDLDCRLIFQFRGYLVTSAAALFAYRDVDDAYGLTVMAVERRADARSGRNSRHALVGFAASVGAIGRLAGLRGRDRSSCLVSKHQFGSHLENPG
jgi:hypothetical protein